MNEYINKKTGEDPIHKLLQELSLNELLWSYDANSLYPSAMSDPESINPRIETGYAFTTDINDKLVEKFNSGNFTQRSAILGIKYYNPKNIMVQHFFVKERVRKREINCTRNGYIVQTLTSVDIKEIVKIGGKVVETYEGVIYRENFKVSPFKKVFDELFELQHIYKNDNNDVMELLVKLIMHSLYGEQIRKDIEKSCQCKSEIWMMTECDESVLDYQKINYGKYIVKMKDDEGLQDEVKKVNAMPLHLGAFVLSNSKRIMNKYIQAVDGFFSKDVYYTDTDSLYIKITNIGIN